MQPLLVDHFPPLSHVIDADGPHLSFDAVDDARFHLFERIRAGDALDNIDPIGRLVIQLVGKDVVGQEALGVGDNLRSVVEHRPDIGDLEHHCDRVVEIRRGLIVRDNCTTGSNEPMESAVGTALPSITPATMSNGQFGILVGREVALLQADFWSRLAVPAIVATLFAVAVGVAIESTHVPLLGYLSIVSVLWMSASSSLLAIAGEREVFEHERQLVLSVRHYLAAKFMVAVAVAASQTFLFLGALWSVRYVLDRAQFKSPIWAVAILIATSVVGVSLGLCLSALAGRKKETATFLLPLVMISQLVFSVPVAYPDATRDSVESAYTKFHPAEGNVRLAASISMLTITRPADMALRSQSYDEPDERAAEHAKYAAWGAATLLGWMVALLLITLLLLLRRSVYSSVCKRIQGLLFAGR